MAEVQLPITERADQSAAKKSCQEYDLLFLVDATASMGSYLFALNQALPEVITLSKLTNCFAQIGILAYRDYDCFSGDLLEWSGWLTIGGTGEQPDLVQMARKLRMEGGHSWPEAIKTGLARAYELMRVDAQTLVILCADAPPHFMKDTEHQAGLEERVALSVKRRYGEHGHMFADWIKGSRLLREGDKAAQVISIVNSESLGTWRGSFEALSTITGGICVKLHNTMARNISQITIDILLTWMGVQKEGAKTAPLAAALSHYRNPTELHSIRSEEDGNLDKYIHMGYDVSGTLTVIETNRLTMELLERHLHKRPAPLQDLSQMYEGDTGYRMLVVKELRNVIENDVTTMSLNPVFGSLWRTFCNDRQNSERDSLLNLFSIKIEAIKDIEKRQMMKSWLEQSYDYSADVLELIESVRDEDKFPCVCLDPTLRFEPITGAEEDDRPITDFTRDELLEIGRSCDWKVLKRLGKVLTRLTFIESAEDVPAHIAAADAGQVTRVPLALARKDYGRKLWNILLHIVVPGTKLGGRAATLVAALTIRLGVKTLLDPAVEQMQRWKDRWNNLEVPETWNVSCLALILDADKAYVSGRNGSDGLVADSDRALFERLIDYKMLDLNLETTLAAKVTWTVDHTVMPIGPLVTCKSCKYPRSVTIMAADGLCGMCYFIEHNPAEDRIEVARGATLQDNEETDAAWYECNLAHCRAQYIVYGHSDLNVKPKCHYCRFFNGKAPVVECAQCLGRMIWPEEYRPRNMHVFACMGCRSKRETVVETETSARALRIENGTSWLVRDQEQKIKEVFSGQSLFKLAAAAAPLDTFPSTVEVLPSIPDLKLQLRGRAVQNTQAVVRELRSWISKRRTEAATCSLCFRDQRKNGLLPACGRSGCHQRVCHECLNSWCGLNNPGQIINTAALHCPFCRRTPTAKILSRNGSGIHAVGQLKHAVENSGSWIYAWCVTCGTAKQYMERICAQGMPETIIDWSCADCEAAKSASGAVSPAITRKECPGCGVLTEKGGGCDHVECICGVHWCFFCGEQQDEHIIYNHMSAKHGGYYGGEDAHDYESDEDEGG